MGGRHEGQGERQEVRSKDAMAIYMQSSHHAVYDMRLMIPLTLVNFQDRHCYIFRRKYNTAVMVNGFRSLMNPSA